MVKFHRQRVAKDRLASTVEANNHALCSHLRWWADKISLDF